MTTKTTVLAEDAGRHELRVRKTFRRAERVLAVLSHHALRSSVNAAIIIAMRHWHTSSRPAKHEGNRVLPGTITP